MTAPDGQRLTITRLSLLAETLPDVGLEAVEPDGRGSWPARAERDRAVIWHHREGARGGPRR